MFWKEADLPEGDRLTSLLAIAYPPQHGVAVEVFGAMTSDVGQVDASCCESFAKPVERVIQTLKHEEWNAFGIVSDATPGPLVDVCADTVGQPCRLGAAFLWV